MENFDTLNAQARLRRRQLDTSFGEARATLMRGKGLQTEVKELAELTQDLDRVNALLNSIGENRQLAAQNTIEELVTWGLRTIFDDTLSFHIVQSVRSKTVSVEFLVRTTLSDSVVETPVMESRGGGIAATIGFLLRVVVMLLTRGDGLEKILVLDETFAHVSAEYLEPLGLFLQELVQKSDIQVLLVTHQPEFIEYADRVYKFRTVGGETVVTQEA